VLWGVPGANEGKAQRSVCIWTSQAPDGRREQRLQAEGRWESGWVRPGSQDEGVSGRKKWLVLLMGARRGPRGTPRGPRGDHPRGPKGSSGADS